MIALAIDLASMGGAGGSAPFSPASLTNLQAWYRADKGITLNVTKVSQWNDSSGSGDANRNAAQATGANQPTFNASDATYGGQPTVQFGGAGNTTNIFLDTGVWGSSFGQPLTVFIVGNAQVSTTNYFLDNAADTLEVYSTAGVQIGFDALLSGALVTTVPSLLFIGAGGAGADTIAFNSKTVGTTGSSGGSPNTTTKLRLGCYIGGGNFSLGGPMAELAFYNRALTLVERGQLVTYANARYGLSAT